MYRTNVPLSWYVGGGGGGGAKHYTVIELSNRTMVAVHVLNCYI